MEPIDPALGALAQEIVQGLQKRAWRAERRVFLCGATAKNKRSAREALAAELAGVGNLEVYYPEVLFDELLTGVDHHDLLSLENLLAEGVTAIVIVLEGAGAICELGAFANHERLRDKLIVLQDREREREHSFIQYGPIRLLRKQSKNSVHSVDFTDPRALRQAVTRSLSHMPYFDTFNVENLFHAQEFILPVLYVRHTLTRHELKASVSSVCKGPVNAEALVNAALSLLRKEGLVVSTDRGVSLTPAGQLRARRKSRDNLLDELQVGNLHRVCRQEKRPFPGS